jgi:hypothetical protein
MRLLASLTLRVLFAATAPGLHAGDRFSACLPVTEAACHVSETATPQAMRCGRGKGVASCLIGAEP